MTGRTLRALGMLGGLRPVRHAALTTGIVLAVCAALVAVALGTLTAATGRIDAATGRAVGSVERLLDDGSVLVRWSPPGEAARVDPVPVAGPPPAPGTRTEVAFDPTRPGEPLIPGAVVLVEADRALTTLALCTVVGVGVLGVLGWQVATRRRALLRPARTVAVRRVRWQQALLTRSYLETETSPQRWIPVHFDAVLVGLPAPTAVLLHGDPLRDRLVAASVPDPDGNRPLFPSGGVRAAEPRGRRTDNPSRTDATAPRRAAALARMRCQLQADLPLVVPAPFVGLLWTYVDRGGLSSWLAATAVTAALGLWSGALRGSDPS